MDSHRTAVRRTLISLAVLALIWSAIVAITGGIGITLAGVRVSSRNPRNPLLIALASACTAALLARRRPHELRQDVRSLVALVMSAWHAYSRRRVARWLGLPTVTAIGGATLIVVHWLRARPLWLDEEMIALNVRDRSFVDLAGKLWLDQSAPLGWLAAERVVMRVFGMSETAARALPALAGIAAVAAAAWIGRRWMTTPGAIALVAMSSLGLWVFHYSLELKPYSGDTLSGFLLPTLVLWAVEAETPRRRLRRAAIWWTVAALGQWWAYGALFIAPACAVALVVAMWCIDGWRRAASCAVFGIGWLISFGVNYLLVLRFTLENDFLRQYFSVAIPPGSSAVMDIAQWLGRQPVLLATAPGGSTLPALFWATALCGFLLARPRRIGYVAAAVPLSAVVLAIAGGVPLYERLSLWVVPALYVGIASCVDAGAIRMREAYARARRAGVVVGLTVLVAGASAGVDIVRRGWQDARARPPDSNHGYDDRSGVRWLLAQRQRGDAVLATMLSLPGVWWYGGVPLSLVEHTTMFPDGTPLFEIFHAPREDDCNLRPLLAPYSRALVYMGFPDRPEGFDELVLRELAAAAQVLEVRRFSTSTLAAVVELHPAAPPVAANARRRFSQATGLDGCIAARPARRW